MMARRAEKFTANLGKVKAKLQKLKISAAKMDATLSNADANLESLEQTRKTAVDLIERLRSVIAELEQLESTSAVSDQSAQVLHTKDDTQTTLNRMQLFNDTLTAQLVLLQQFYQMYQRTDKSGHELHYKMTGLLSQYQQPQPLLTAKQDSAMIDSLRKMTDLLSQYQQPQPLPMAKQGLATIVSLLSHMHKQMAAIDRLREISDQMPVLTKPKQEVAQLANQLHAMQVCLKDLQEHRRTAIAKFVALTAQVEMTVGAVHNRTQLELHQSATNKLLTADQLSSRVQLLDGALADLQAVHPQIDMLRALANSLCPAKQLVQRVNAVQAHKDNLVHRIQNALSENQMMARRAEKFTADLGKVEAKLQKLKISAAKMDATLSNADANLESLKQTRKTAVDLIERLCSEADANQVARDAVLGELEQMDQATRGMDKLAAALDQVTKMTEQVEAAVADRSTNASALGTQLAVIDQPIARVDAISSSVERLSAQPLSADQATQVVAIGDNARIVRDRLLAVKQSMEAWLALRRDFDQAKQPIASRLAHMEAETASMDAKYQQARPLAEAIEDVRIIQSLWSAVQDERAHVGAMQDLVTRLDGRFEIVTEKASFADRVESLDAQLTDFLYKLSPETDVEGALLNAHSSTLTELNAIGDVVVGVSRSPTQSPADANRKAAELAKIRAQLNALQPRVNCSWDRQAKLVEQTRTSDLAAQRDQLLTAVDDASRELATRCQLVAVAPTIEIVIEALRGRLNELETTQHHIPFNEHQRQLDELEAKRAELERALALIPDGPNGDELRRKAEWNLSQLTDWLKRLGHSQRDKLATLDAGRNAAHKISVKPKLYLLLEERPETDVETFIVGESPEIAKNAVEDIFKVAASKFSRQTFDTMMRNSKEIMTFYKKKFDQDILLGHSISTCGIAPPLKCQNHKLVLREVVKNVRFLLKKGYRHRDLAVICMSGETKEIDYALRLSDIATKNLANNNKGSEAVTILSPTDAKSYEWKAVIISVDFDHERQLALAITRATTEFIIVQDEAYERTIEELKSGGCVLSPEEILLKYASPNKFKKLDTYCHAFSNVKHKEHKPTEHCENQNEDRKWSIYGELQECGYSYKNLLNLRERVKFEQDNKLEAQINKRKEIAKSASSRNVTTNGSLRRNEGWRGSKLSLQDYWTSNFDDESNQFGRNSPERTAFRRHSLNYLSSRSRQLTENVSSDATPTTNGFIVNGSLGSKFTGNIPGLKGKMKKMKNIIKNITMKKSSKSARRRTSVVSCGPTIQEEREAS